MARATLERISALAAAPSENQRRVFVLRDVEGYTSSEVCEMLEVTLPPALQDAADRHLADCPHCREYLEQMRRAVSFARGLRDDDVPPDVVDALTRAFAEYRSGGTPTS